MALSCDEITSHVAKSNMDAAVKLDLNIRQMREALCRIRDEAATKENGAAWAAGLANLCLATLRR
jgi:hypothetical protein